jgi:hypothetical protein
VNRRVAEPALVSSTLAADDRSARRCYYAAMAVVAVLMIVPVWLVEYPPLVDYPNHIARCYIRHAGDSVAVLAERYTFDNTPIPCLAMDVMMAALETFLDVHTAGKVFLTITLLVYLLGGHLLGWAIHGRPSWLALGTGLFAYHSMFLYGFTNYSLSVGIFLVALAGWLVWSRRPGLRSLLLFQAMVLLCYFTHLGGFLLLAGAVGVIGLWRGMRERRMTAYLTMMLPFVPAAALFVLFRPNGTGNHEIVWSTLAEKAVGALCLVRTYNASVDIAYLLMLAALVTTTALAVRRVEADGGVLLAGLAFVAMFVIGPAEIDGASPADARFLPAAAALLLLAPQLTVCRRRAVPLVAAVIALIGVHTAVIASEWLPQDRELAAQVAMFEQLPDGARLYPLVAQAGDAASKRDRCMWHAAHYATVVRHACSPGLLAYPGQQPIRYRQAPPWLHSGAHVEWERIFNNYDYIWCYKAPDYGAFLEQRCTVIASSANGVIFRVK